MYEKLSAAQRWFLDWCPALGLVPGSNMWPLVVMEDRTGSCDGEEVDELFRGGLIAATPLDEPKFMEAGLGDIPDLEATHRIDITPAGRALLAERKPKP